MEGEHVIPDEIRQLLERRSTFQEWLHRLDELGADFRPTVADKVRADYATRLSGVEGELQGHREALESTLGKRRAAASDVEAKHDARSAELEESRLRHTVGEFDDAAWEKQRGEHQAVLDKLDAELSEHRAAVDMLEVVLGELNAPPRKSPSPVAAEEEPAPAAEEEPAPVAEEEPAPVTEASAEETAMEEGAPSEDADPEAEPARDPSEFADELEFLESLSLDDASNFDAVSAMLDEAEEGGDGRRDADAGHDDR